MSIFELSERSCRKYIESIRQNSHYGYASEVKYVILIRIRIIIRENQTSRLQNNAITQER